MSVLLSVPYIARLLLSLVGILILQKLSKRLDLALILGALILAFWTGQSPSAIARITADRALSWDMFFLAFVIAGVICLSTLMAKAGAMKDLVASLRQRLSNRALLAALPAVVGLLPMPAGALFSCPLVDDADDKNALSPMAKTRINYWFRHCWEFCWPMYPGMLLAVDLSGLPIWGFVLLMLPLFFAAWLAGYVFFLKNMPKTKASARFNPERKAFLPLILPVLTVVLVYAATTAVAPGLNQVSKYLPMAIGILAGLAVLQWQRPQTAAVWREAAFSTRGLGLVLIMVLVRIYGAFVEAKLGDGSFLMDHVREELNLMGIPALILIVLIPFISGLTTGITIGYIGASFPVVLSLALPGTGGLFATIALGYASGFLGMMLSPIHVCLIVTNDYFKTNMIRSLYGILRPALFMFILAAGYAGVLQLW